MEPLERGTLSCRRGFTYLRKFNFNFKLKLVLNCRLPPLHCYRYWQSRTLRDSASLQARHWHQPEGAVAHATGGPTGILEPRVSHSAWSGVRASLAASVSAKDGDVRG